MADFIEYLGIEKDNCSPMPNRSCFFDKIVALCGHIGKNLSSVPNESFYPVRLDNFFGQYTKKLASNTQPGVLKASS